MRDRSHSDEPDGSEILCYLIRNPQASDTVEGIVEWWLLQQRIEHSLAQVKEALARLVARGLVVAHEGRDGRTHYRADAKKKPEILEYLNRHGTVLQTKVMTSGSATDHPLWLETSWFAIQAKPHQEKLAVGTVADLNLETLLPRIRREQSVCGVRRLVSKPLFGGYFFARFCPRISLEVVRYARGVLRVLGTFGHPIPVDDEIIESIKGRVQEDGFVHLETRPFRPGDKVTIEQGPFTGWMGKVEREWTDGKRVLLLLEAVQQTRALMEKGWLKLANPG